MQIPQLIVFDLGGTIVRDRGDVPAAFASALDRAGVAFDAAELSGWRGASKREVLNRLVSRQGLPASTVEQTYAEFGATLRARFSDASDLAFPAAAGVLSRLKSAGVRLALNSGFDRDIVDILLASMSWPAGTFDTIVCSGDVPRGRPEPFMILLSMERLGVVDARRVAVVGDTQLDLEAGWRAGAAYRIGVLSGAHDRAALERAPYTHIVDDCSGVPAICLDGVGVVRGSGYTSSAS